MSRLNTPSTNGAAQQKALDTAASILPGGVLGSTLLPEDLKFVFSVYLSVGYVQPSMFWMA